MMLGIEGKVRKDILDAAYAAGKTGAHIAPSLSLVEIILAVLNEKKEQDRIILSKGHGALGYYAAMHQTGMILDEQFVSFESDGGDFPGQPSRSRNNHVDYSSGSLGMGLSYASGLAYHNHDRRIFVIMGDGETDEGSVWEAAGFIAHKNLKNVIVLIDKNGLQSDGRTEDITGRNSEVLWKSYGWDVIKCDGHNTDVIADSIRSIKDKPTVILAETIKGKGISFMENNNEWHHHELNRENYDLAVKEIGERYGLCER